MSQECALFPRSIEPCRKLKIEAILGSKIRNTQRKILNKPEIPLHYMVEQRFNPAIIQDGEAIVAMERTLPAKTCPTSVDCLLDAANEALRLLTPKTPFLRITAILLQ